MKLQKREKLCCLLLRRKFYIYIFMKSLLGNFFINRPLFTTNACRYAYARARAHTHTHTHTHQQAQREIGDLGCRAKICQEGLTHYLSRTYHINSTKPNPSACVCVRVFVCRCAYVCVRAHVFMCGSLSL
jgi:hypothetical protein